MSLILLMLIHFAGLDNRFNKKSIKIEFEEGNNTDSFIKKIIETKIVYYYTEEHTNNDLHIFLLDELGLDEMIIQDGLELRFHIKEKDECKYF